MSTTEIITAIKDIALSGAAITTATVAILGLKSWSRELKGKAEFEVGRALILATYKLRDELKYARSPWISGYEFPEDYPRNSDERTAEIEANAYAHIYSKRWKPVAEAIQEFETQALEGEALWGKPMRDKTNEMKQCARNLQVSIDAFIHNKAEDGESFKNDREFAKSVKSDVWAANDDKNKLTIQISNAVQALEEEIRPHLKRS
ncbi:hypothetical protein [Vibrio lentus]|uniref:hypothetical protein n=1 Tax=Vibrio lentus TaxID=136468 RepID=UPI000C8566C8|nr:hypothetical protein [Vibrio lentus]PMG71507.1 hypothetical protein BCU86_23390 [Vibrio lentus]PMJ03375.1 hypothetical protein BCU32_21905 [Vibrio lentus]